MKTQRGSGGITLLILSLDTGRIFSGQLHSPAALHLGKEYKMFNATESEPVWTDSRREKTPFL